MYTTTMTYTKHTTQNTNREHTMQRCGEKAPSLLLLPHHLYMVMTQSPKQGSNIAHKRFHIRWFNLRCSMALLFLFGDSFKRCVCVPFLGCVLVNCTYWVKQIGMICPTDSSRGSEAWSRAVVSGCGAFISKNEVNCNCCRSQKVSVCLFVCLFFSLLLQ